MTDPEDGRSKTPGAPATVKHLANAPRRMVGTACVGFIWWPPLWADLEASPQEIHQLIELLAVRDEHL
jgi:hypothetical protein